MKTFVFLCFTTVFSFSPSNVLSQNGKIKIDTEKTISVPETFELIRQQVGYKFIYNDDLVDNAPKVMLRKGTIKVKELLRKALAPIGCTFEFTKNETVVVKRASKVIPIKKEVQIIIHGLITDENGGPLPGASIVEKGTANGTQTDFDGNFTLGISDENATIIVSYIGYKTQEIAINGQTNVNVVLKEDTASLDEVVVVGYGVQKKENLTAAVEMVNTDIIENRPVSSVGEMLSGAVPNLNIRITSGAPGATPSFNIRGFTGIGVSAEPLILVDGAEQDIDLLNANDIESISVLKDQAATAIYGSRGADGVILIKTKAGKKNQKPNITYSSDFIYSIPSSVFEIADSYDWVVTQNNKFYNNRESPRFSDLTLQGILDNAAGTGPVNIERANGTYGAHFDATNATQDRIDLAYRDFALNTNHNLGISGGSEKSTYYIGLGVFDTQGILDSPVDDNKRYSVTSRLSTDLTDWLTVRTNIRYGNEENIRALYSDRTIQGNGRLYFFPNVPSINPNGDYHWLSILPAIRGETGNNQRYRNDISLQGGFDFKPFKNLKVVGDYTYINNSTRRKQEQKWLRVEEANGSLRSSGRTPRQDRVSETLSQLSGHSANIYTTYTKDFDGHDFTGTFGYQEDVRNFFSLNTSRRDAYSQDLLTLNTTYGEITTSDRIWSWATQGYFLRASYNYKGKYLFDFNSRYDASSRYAIAKRWSFNPSLSFGYNIAKENFWPLKDVQTFKITGSWAESGRQKVDFNGDGSTTTNNGEIYVATSTLETGQTGYLLNNDRQPFIETSGRLISPDLTWTKPRTIGAGLEIAALRNRLNIEYDWYQRTIFDEIGPADQLPEVLGIAPPSRNNSVVETRGWELSLSWKDEAFNIADAPLRYSVRAAISDYIGYVVEYQDNIDGQRRNGNAGAWTRGEQFGVLYGYADQQIITSADELQEKFLWRGGWNYPGSTYIPDLNGDGRLDNGNGGFWYSQGDRVKLGYTYPRYTYSVFFNTGWKNLDLSVLLDGVGKQEVFSTHSIFIGSSVGGRGGDPNALQMHQDLGYWSVNNPNGFYPRVSVLGAGVQPSKRYLVDASHLRIKNINLNFSFPKEIAQKAKLSFIKLNLSAENVGFIYRKSRLPMDPVQITTAQGRTYPIQSRISIGLRVGL